MATNIDDQDLNSKFIQPLDKLGFLVAGIVHNLFGPLTAMIGTIEILKMKYPDLSTDLERLERLTARLQGDISVIMNKVQGEGIAEPEEVNLVELVNNELLFFKGDPRIKHMIDVQVKSDDNIPVFNAIYRDFSIPIDHILTNAIEAMSDVEEKILEIDIKHSGENIILSFSDNGCGMDSETMEKAFEPFYSTKEYLQEGKYPPTLARGLGLSHAAKLLEPLGCKIGLKSEKDKGTTVSIEIPYEKIEKEFSAGPQS